MPTHRPSRPRRAAALLGAALLCAMALPTGGCNYVAAGAYLVHGPPKTPAQYKLNGDRRTVVFVDDRTSATPRRSLRQTIGEAAERALIAYAKVDAAKTIPSQAALRVSAQDRAAEQMSVIDIGRMVGAEVVVYVTVDRFALSPDGVTYQPTAIGRVKVFDTTTNARLFPIDGAGASVFANIPTSGAEFPSSGSERARAEDVLAAAFGERVAKVFYEHESDSLSGSLDD